ncbi:MAG: DUF4167 domain-containing protein [Methyloceanibacter sp.]|jgi:hypothetical protein
MRQGQQNRRGRGRGRKPQNPLARNFESNGPDVKIRGTAAHVAEKYMSLARDALASGDLVSAESYLQHAEHYNRIIMAAQAQFGPQHGGHQGESPNGGYRNPRWNSEGSDDEGGEFDVEGGGEIRTGGSGDIRAGGGGDFRGGGGGQDRERHEGNREHHGGGREHDRHGGNGREDPRERDANGTDQPEAHPSDETAPDQVS